MFHFIHGCKQFVWKCRTAPRKICEIKPFFGVLWEFRGVGGDLIEPRSLGSFLFVLYFVSVWKIWQNWSLGSLERFKDVFFSSWKFLRVLRFFRIARLFGSFFGVLGAVGALVKFPSWFGVTWVMGFIRSFWELFWDHLEDLCGFRSFESFKEVLIVLGSFARVFWKPYESLLVIYSSRDATAWGKKSQEEW